jgi:hypothetical protein
MAPMRTGDKSLQATPPPASSAPVKGAPARLARRPRCRPRAITPVKPSPSEASLPVTSDEAFQTR